MLIDLDAEVLDNEAGDETEETITFEMVSDITKASWVAKEQNKAARSPSE